MEEDVMDPLESLARAVTLGLGGLTQLSVRIFETLGVDMASIEESLAGWTQYAQELKARGDASDAHAADLATQLEAAGQTLTDWQAADAADDAAQAEALKAQIADQIAAALEAAKNPPPPVEPPPVVEEPPVEEPAPPVPVDPEAPPQPAGELPPETPVVEVPPDTTPPVDVPPDAPVVPAGELPPDTTVVPVEPPAEAAPEDPQINPLGKRRR